jgi:hypothetical protein
VLQAETFGAKRATMHRQPRPHTKSLLPLHKSHARLLLSGKAPLLTDSHRHIQRARPPELAAVLRRQSTMAMVLGMVLGKIPVETPKHEVLHTGAGYEIRKYPPSIAAELTYDPKEMRGDPDGGFTVLANYIGVLGKPQNTKPEKIAMTAPVITTGSGSGGDGEKIAMTAPVITTGGGEPEPIAMTAPVITDDQQAPGKVTMQFLLPSKYTRVEEAPRPTDERVVIREVPERKFGVARFSGVATDRTVREKAKGLKAALEKDGYTIKGPFVLARYNPSFTLPPLRTNEVMFPVE